MELMELRELGQLRELRELREFVRQKREGAIESWKVELSRVGICISFSVFLLSFLKVGNFFLRFGKKNFWGWQKSFWGRKKFFWSWQKFFWGWQNFESEVNEKSAPSLPPKRGIRVPKPLPRRVE